jgi:hypothetical protein
MFCPVLTHVKAFLKMQNARPSAQVTRMLELEIPPVPVSPQNVHVKVKTAYGVLEEPSRLICFALSEIIVNIQYIFLLKCTRQPQAKLFVMPIQLTMAYFYLVDQAVLSTAQFLKKFKMESLAIAMQKEFANGSILPLLANPG